MKVFLTVLLLFSVLRVDSQISTEENRFDNYLENNAADYTQIGSKHCVFNWNQGVVSFLETNENSAILTFTDKNDSLVWTKDIPYFNVKSKRSSVIFKENSNHIYIVNRIYTESDNMISDPRLFTIQSVNYNGDLNSKEITLSDLNKNYPQLSLAKRNSYQINDIEIVSEKLFIHFLVEKKQLESFLFSYLPNDSLSIAQIIPNVRSKKITSSRITYAGHNDDQLFFVQTQYLKGDVFFNHYLIDAEEITSQTSNSPVLINSQIEGELYLLPCSSLDNVWKRSSPISQRFTSHSNYLQRHFQITKYSNDQTYVIYGLCKKDKKSLNVNGIWWSELNALAQKDSVNLNIIELTEESSNDLESLRRIDLGGKNGDYCFRIWVNNDPKNLLSSRAVFLKK